MSLFRVTAALVAIGITGCATDIPVPVANPSSNQLKLRASHHWDIVARDIAKQTKVSLDRVMDLRGVIVNKPTNPSAFEGAMSDFVTTRLVEQGVPVLTAPGNALQVSYSTQLIVHGSDRTTVVAPLVAIAAGIMVGYNVNLHAHRDLASAAGLGALAGLDLLSWNFGSGLRAPKSEVIVTTSISDGRVYLMRKTDIYYIDDADLSLFIPPKIIPPLIVPIRSYLVDGGKP